MERKRPTREYGYRIIDLTDNYEYEFHDYNVNDAILTIYEFMKIDEKPHKYKIRKERLNG